MDALELRTKLAQKVADIRVGGTALVLNEHDYDLADDLLPLIREAQAQALEEAAAYRVGEGVAE